MRQFLGEPRAGMLSVFAVKGGQMDKRTYQDQEKKLDLQKAYEDLSKLFSGHSQPRQESSLKQPSKLKVVESVTTYGAYEEPI